MREYLTQLMLGKNLSTRESLFRVIVFVGQSLAVIALIESMVNTGCDSLFLVQILELLVMSVAAVVVFKFKKLNPGIILGWIAMTVIEFPFSFIFSGGTNGGAAVWFALGLFYVFMMFQGKALTVFLLLTIVIDSMTYLVSYLGIVPVTPISSEQAVYLDSFFGAIAVGCASGVIMRFQIRFYQKEKELAEKQNKELEKAARAQGTFFASMSHEIRTPINSIIGFNEMIRRKSDSEEIAGYAENVQLSGRILLDLVNDILDYSQLEQNRMKILNAEYSSVEMFRSVVQMIQIRTQEKNLNFEIEIDSEMPLYLIGDQKRVEQILINLLTNAVKYTDEGTVRLAAFSEVIGEKNAKITISVQDTGIGIRKENLDRLYDAFERVDGGLNRNVEGSGLGLAITKQLLNLMDGSISVDSIFTKGTTFTVTFLQKLVDDRTIGKVDFTRNFGQGRSVYTPLFEAPEARVLVVEDNRMNALILRELLSETKMQLEVVESGRECMDKTAEKYYHLILMDYMLPDMNGVEILKELRRQENGLCKDTPVILMTASHAAEAQRMVNEFSFDTYLEKPIQPEQLEQELICYLPESVIEHRSSESIQGDKEHAVGHIIRRKPLCITSDSISDIPEKLLEQLDIKVVSLYIRTDKGRFADSKEIDSDNMLQYLTDTNSYATADSLSVEEYEQFYADCLERAENVIHISMAEKVGKSYGVAVAAAAGFDHVRVINSGQISCGEGLLVIYAAQLARDGVPAEEICNRIDALKSRIHTRFIMPNAHVFYQNGYTNRITAKLCNLFHAHPVIYMTHSHVFILGAYFGKLENAWKRFIQFHLGNKNSIDTRIVYITYTNLTAQQQEYIKEEIMKQIPFEQVIMRKASFSTACSAGVETMGFAFLKKE